MAVAMIHPEYEKGGRGKQSGAVKLASSGGFASQRTNECRAVLKWARELADPVLAGAESLELQLLNCAAGGTI